MAVTRAAVAGDIMDIAPVVRPREATEEEEEEEKREGRGLRKASVPPTASRTARLRDTLMVSVWWSGWVGWVMRA